MESKVARTIKVHILGRTGREIKEASLEEAKAILKETFADPLGGLVIDRRTGQVISEIGPNVEEVSIVNLMVGGG